MELRQLRYFVTLAEELHFGRAAAREHIVQSALSQQIQRLEHELGVVLVERSTHHVRLTRSGETLLADARQILDRVQLALVAARDASRSASLLRVAVGDPSFDSMPQILGAVQRDHPHLIIHRVEASVPEQFRMLADGRLDVGVGRAAHAPADVASELFRLDRLGLVIATGHRFARLRSVPLRLLAGEAILFADPARSPEFNEFVVEACRSVGFSPTSYPGSVQSVRAAADLVGQGRCVAFAPASCDVCVAAICWRPLAEPELRYPWSLLWPAGRESAAVSAVRSSARGLSAKLDWLADRVRPEALAVAGTPGGHQLRR